MPNNEERGEKQKPQEYKTKQLNWTKVHLINAKGYIYFSIHKALCTFNTPLNLKGQDLLNT